MALIDRVVESKDENGRVLRAIVCLNDTCSGFHHRFDINAVVRISFNEGYFYIYLAGDDPTSYADA